MSADYDEIEAMSDEEFFALMDELVEQNLAEAAVIKQTIENRLCPDGELTELRTLLKDLRAINKRYS